LGSTHMRVRLGYTCLILIVIVGLVIGIHYLVSPEITSYHKQVIGVSWEDLAPGTQTLLIILMKGTGLAALVTAVSLSIIIAIPLRRGESWARWAVLAIGLILLVPMLGGALYLAITKEASTPWWLDALAIVVLVVGVLLVGGPRQRKNA
jgi:hypothetical protein